MMDIIADADGRRRRSWSVDEKRMVEESLEPGASVSVVDRRYDVNANLLFSWRRQFQDGRLMAETAPVPVELSAAGRDRRPGSGTSSFRPAAIAAGNDRDRVDERQPFAPARVDRRGCPAPGHRRARRTMIALPAGSRVRLAAGITDLRKGFDGLAALVQTVLDKDPFSGHLFCFRGRRGDLVKILWWDGDGLCLSPSAWSEVGSYGRGSSKARPC